MDMFSMPNPTWGDVRFVGLSPTRRYTYKMYSLVGKEMLFDT